MSESLADVNRMLHENNRHVSRALTLLCAASKPGSGDPVAVRRLLPRLCGCHNLNRALVGRLLENLDVDEPCCYPGPLKARLPCGPTYPQPPILGLSAKERHAQRSGVKYPEDVPRA